MDFKFSETNRKRECLMLDDKQLTGSIKILLQPPRGEQVWGHVWLTEEITQIRAFVITIIFAF